jgi:hypothetical protein
VSIDHKTQRDRARKRKLQNDRKRVQIARRRLRRIATLTLNAD